MKSKNSKEVFREMNWFNILLGSIGIALLFSLFISLTGGLIVFAVFFLISSLISYFVVKDRDIKPKKKISEQEKLLKKIYSRLGWVLFWVIFFGVLILLAIG